MTKLFILFITCLVINVVVADRADDLISQMSRSEKLKYLCGNGMGNYPEDGEYVGTVLATDRLSIPALLYNDGPQVGEIQAFRNSVKTILKLNARRASPFFIIRPEPSFFRLGF